MEKKTRPGTRLTWSWTGGQERKTSKNNCVTDRPTGGWIEQPISGLGSRFSAAKKDENVLELGGT